MVNFTSVLYNEEGLCKEVGAGGSSYIFLESG